MAWIESHQSLLTHRKTGRLARSLNVSKVTAIGHLHVFWWWCLDNTQDGSLTDCDAAEIADAACWEGDATAFVAAMIHAGFIDQNDSGGLMVHAWDEYSGKLTDRRERNKLAMRAARAAAKGETPDNPAVLDTCATRDDTCKATVPTEQNRTEQRERENAHARTHGRGGNVATASAAPVSLSLSLVASATPEPEPEQSQNEPALQPETPENLIHAACVVALGHGPTTGRIRRKWRNGVADLARLNVTADDIPKLVRQYHAKYGDSIPCEPWNLADHYSELGVSPHVVSQLHPVGRSSAQAPALTPEEFTRRKRAALSAGGLTLPALPSPAS